MHLSLVDHILAVAIVVLLPVSGVWEFSYLRRQLAAGVPDARIRGYRLVLGIEWGLVAVVVAAWLLGGRSLPGLGFGMRTGMGTWIGWGVTGVFIALILLEGRSVFTSEKKFGEAKQALTVGQAHLVPLIPRTDREWRWFRVLGITAGVCEETLHRGFLIAYLAALTGVWPAVALSSVAFGLGHVYQGAGGVLKTSLLGLVFALLYVFTGSLWAPVVLHAIVDLNSGYIGYRVLTMLEGTRDNAAV